MSALDLGASAHYSLAAAAHHAHWRAYRSHPPTARHAAFLATWEQLVTLHDAGVPDCDGDGLLELLTERARVD